MDWTVQGNGMGTGLGAKLLAGLRSHARLVGAGAAVLVISSEPEELMRICDRYLVMSRGRVTTRLPVSATRADLLAAVSAAPVRAGAA